MTPVGFSRDDWPTLIVFLVVVAGWIFKKKAPTKDESPRKEPRDEERSPRAESLPPPPPLPSRPPPPRPRAPLSTRPAPARRAPIEGSAAGRTPALGDAPKKTTGPPSPLSDFAATRAQQTTPKGERPGASAPMPPAGKSSAMAGRAMLKAGDLSRRDRVRAALAWSIVLGPPRSRDRGLPGRPRR